MPPAPRRTTRTSLPAAGLTALAVLAVPGLAGCGSDDGGGRGGDA